MATTSLYSISTREKLLKLFAGKTIEEVPTPAAVLDLSKTTELTRLQVGDGNGPVNICVSTIIEAEHVVPLLLGYKSRGRSVNVLYAFPLTPSSVPRLALIAKALGPHGLSLMIDHPAQLPSVAAIHQSSSVAPDVFLKIDVGYKRAGVAPQSAAFTSLVSSLLDFTSSGVAHFLGLYAHAGQSYDGSSRVTALNCLRQEFDVLLNIAQRIHSISPTLPLILSVGATPQTTSIRNLLIPSSSSSLSPGENDAIAALRNTVQAIRDTNSTLEIHAGVYTVLDLQQLSTRALPTEGPHAMLTWDDLAFTIVVEIASIYPGRGSNDTTEYLAAAGCLALGREPCKAYSGWGILTPWNRSGIAMPVGSPEGFEGHILGKISQEHGIVTWKGASSSGESGDSFEVGQKVRVWPNHACIAGAGFGWYLIVDSSLKGREDEIVDVWPRWRGW